MKQPAHPERKLEYRSELSGPPATDDLIDLSSSAPECSSICNSRLVCDKVEVRMVEEGRRLMRKAEVLALLKKATITVSNAGLGNEMK